MNLTILFFLGLAVALIGVIPPGLLNMTAAKISLKEGSIKGIMFSIGVCVVVFIQTYIAVIFAGYLNDNPEVIGLLQKVAFVVFVLITIYFLFIAKTGPNSKVKDTSHSKHSRFFYGMFLSSLNLLPIPYQAYMSLSFARLEWLNFEKISVISYVTGAMMGTFVMLYVYIFFFDKIKNSRMTSSKSMNNMIGIITAIIALITLYNILKDSL